MVPPPQIVNFAMLCLLVPTSFSTPAHGLQQGFVVDWLFQKVYRSTPDCLDCHGDVAVTGYEDDRKIRYRLGKQFLQLEAVDSGHAQISHRAIDLTEIWIVKELVRGRKRKHLNPGRLD